MGVVECVSNVTFHDLDGGYMSVFYSNLLICNGLAIYLFVYYISQVK
jgi:hypothetical protein